MEILEALRQKVARVQAGLTNGLFVRDMAMRHERDIMDLQQYQLLQGKSSSGADLRPFYSEDLKPYGWFKSAETAGRYAAWKQEISYPYEVSRNPDAPNLYITGKFHDELAVSFTMSSVEIVGATAYAKQIMAKYGTRNFGLMREKWNALFWDFGGYREVMNEVKKLLYE